jgi:hypothetical protein
MRLTAAYQFSSSQSGRAPQEEDAGNAPRLQVCCHAPTRFELACGSTSSGRR